MDFWFLLLIMSCNLWYGLFISALEDILMGWTVKPLPLPCGDSWWSLTVVLGLFLTAFAMFAISCYCFPWLTCSMSDYVSVLFFWNIPKCSIGCIS